MYTGVYGVYTAWCTLGGPLPRSLFVFSHSLRVTGAVAHSSTLRSSKALLGTAQKKDLGFLAWLDLVLGWLGLVFWPIWPSFPDESSTPNDQGF